MELEAQPSKDSSTNLTQFVAYISLLVLAHIFRAVVRFLFDQGSLLDPHSGNVNASDFNDSILEQAVCLVADVLMSMSVLALLYFQNKDMRRSLMKVNRPGFSDLYGSS